MSDKPKFAREAALAVARELCAALKLQAERIIVAGSLRRRKAEVGDVEILFVPKWRVEPDGLFDQRTVSLVDEALDDLLRRGIIIKRPNARGGTAWGEKNKLAVHFASGIPVDLFTATEANWFNYLVCRTGPGESNIRIATAAQAKGWQWNPYGEGFSRPAGLGREFHAIRSEREVFEFVGLEYKEPWERA